MKKRNKFSLSHYKLGTADMGKLIPISWYEVLPGDTIQQATSVFLRFAPMVAPVMTPVRVQIWSFYVPFRLLWNQWEDFRTGGADGLDASVPPQLVCTNGTTSGNLLDYLGVPPGTTAPISALPLRAYGLIYNEYFRDQDLCTERNIPLDGGLSTRATDNAPAFILANVSWEKDYFTTARPWPQKGLAVTVPVTGTTSSSAITITGNGQPTFTPADTPAAYNMFLKNNKLAAGNYLNDSDNLAWNDPKLKATFVNSTLGIGSVDLNDFREAIALQKFQEARAMYGSRYTEFLRAMGVKSSDARLQRPEYLGGIKNTVQFSEVLQTAADGDNPVGTLRGHGIGATRTKRFRRFVEEDGLVMTLMAVRPIALYSQSLYRGFSRTHKEDYWTKELEHIGQQEVFTKELYSTPSDPNTVFGYQNRYDEYRGIPSTVCGLFRDTLDYWHLGRIFSNEPTLNQSFVEGSPTKRVFAEQTQHEIYFMASHSIQARRLMSQQGNPLI